MSRNQNSLFSTLPSVNIKRTRMRRPQKHIFTGNTGVLIPFYFDEVLPGDTHQIKTSKVVRLQTPITPFMDQLYLDTYYFFVPNRLVWTHWKDFMGENTGSPWVSQVTYSIPQLTTSSQNNVKSGSALDYLGIPVGVPNISFSALPLRAYHLIWQEFFRDENLQYPMNMRTGDTTDSVIGNASPLDGSTAAYSNYQNCHLASKFHDYFTSALPAPQKSANPVSLGLVGQVPVIGDGNPISLTDGTITAPMVIHGPSDSNPADLFFGTTETLTQRNNAQLAQSNSGLVADLGGISVATVNQLRLAFQVQKILEADARGGSRYTEIVRQHFGVVSPDARLQRPEYLGGNRIPINVHQVVQSSESGTTPQGNTAAYSLTVDSHGEFIHSFTEHGMILGLCVVRYDHTYQQGLEAFWQRKTRFDFYWPALAHIGEVGIKNSEIYAQGSGVTDSDGNIVDDQIFGYQEAWSSYRYKPNRTSGEMRSVASNSLDVWHLGDDYNVLPHLSAEWINEDKTNVDRVLQVKSSVSNQLLFDFYIENDTTRPMPLHSVPGLVDHF